jgi:hypothetical protein
MSSEEPTFLNRSFTFIGALGAILIFAVIIYIAYLPNRAPRVDVAKVAERQAKADEARASGVAKLTGYAVVDKAAGTVRIPIELAKELTLKQYTLKTRDQADAQFVAKEATDAVDATNQIIE